MRDGISEYQYQKCHYSIQKTYPHTHLCQTKIAYIYTEATDGLKPTALVWAT